MSVIMSSCSPSLIVSAMYSTDWAKWVPGKVAPSVTLRFICVKCPSRMKVVGGIGKVLFVPTMPFTKMQEPGQVTHVS